MLNNYGVELSKSFNTIWMLQYQILYKFFYFLRNQWKKNIWSLHQRASKV